MSLLHLSGREFIDEMARRAENISEMPYLIS